MGLDSFWSLLNQATASGSRSTVLMETRWFLIISIGALISLVACSAAVWILVFNCFLIALGACLHFGAYIYFAKRSPDALRSERFTLEKMAIEQRSITGDSIGGLIDPMKQGTALEIKGTPPKELPDE